MACRVCDVSEDTRVNCNFLAFALLKKLLFQHFFSVGGSVSRFVRRVVLVDL